MKIVIFPDTHINTVDVSIVDLSKYYGVCPKDCKDYGDKRFVMATTLSEFLMDFKDFSVFEFDTAQELFKWLAE